MKHDVTPEEKTGAVENAPPAKYSLPLPEDTSRCVGCPYPGVGFICWDTDGTCLRTEMDRAGRPGR